MHAISDLVLEQRVKGSTMSGLKVSKSWFYWTWKYAWHAPYWKMLLSADIDRNLLFLQTRNGIQIAVYFLLGMSEMFQVEFWWSDWCFTSIKPHGRDSNVSTSPHHHTKCTICFGGTITWDDKQLFVLHCRKRRLPYRLQWCVYQTMVNIYV